MNTPGFIPANLKAARLLLGYSQLELAQAVGMQQKDISLHENKETKTLIPVRYILFLASKGIDLNTLFRAGEVRLLSSSDRLNLGADPEAPYNAMRRATATERKLKGSMPNQLSPEQWAKLLRLLEKEDLNS